MPVAARNKGMIPPELACKISPDNINLAEGIGRVGKTTFTISAIFLFLGWVGTEKSDQNGVIYLLGPWICPALIAGLLSVVLRHFKAYRGGVWLGGFAYITDDPAVTRLNAIFRSDEARRHLWRESVRFSCIMFVIVWTAALLLRRPLNWTWPSPRNDFLLNERIGQPGSWFWVSMFGPLVCMFIVLFSDCLRWGLTTWAKREAALHSAEE